MKSLEDIFEEFKISLTNKENYYEGRGPSINDSVDQLHENILNHLEKKAVCNVEYVDGIIHECNEFPQHCKKVVPFEDIK